MIRVRYPSHSAHTKRFGAVWDSAPQLKHLILTGVDSIESSAAAAQPPIRRIANARASNDGSTPQSGPISMTTRSTALAPRSAAISAICVSNAWQTDSSCTVAY
jgi:hypothetical protein